MRDAGAARPSPKGGVSDLDPPPGGERTYGPVREAKSDPIPTLRANLASRIAGLLARTDAKIRALTLTGKRPRGTREGGRRPVRGTYKTSSIEFSSRNFLREKELTAKRSIKKKFYANIKKEKNKNRIILTNCLKDILLKLCKALRLFLDRASNFLVGSLCEMHVDKAFDFNYFYDILNSILGCANPTCVIGSPLKAVNA